MKRRLCAIYLLLISAVTICSGVSKEGLLFYHSFENGLDADIARGAKAPVQSAGAEIVPDGKLGKGYVQKKPGVLRFATAGNVNPTSGTIACWVKPLNWEPGERKMRHFFSLGQVKDGETSLMLYKYMNANFIQILGRRPGTNGEYCIYDEQIFPRWKPGEWHHLAFSWSKADNQCILYSDGKPFCGNYNESLLPLKAEDIIGGLSFNSLSETSQYTDASQLTAMDEIYVYDHPIGERGIQELMRDGIKDNVPSFTMPYIHKVPTQDGKMAPGEYDEFFSTNTFVAYCRMGIYNRESQVYTGYDDKNLYVCFKTRTKGGDLNIEIQAQRQERDSDVWLDDAVELLFAPAGKPFTQIVINSIGTVYDAQKGSAAFNGNYEIANLIEGIWWICEIKIPFAELNYGTPRNGDSWKMHLTRDWKNPLDFVALSDTAGFSNIDEMPVWTFGDDKGTGELRLDIEAIQSQRVSVKGTLTDASQDATGYAAIYALKTDGAREILAETAIATRDFKLDYAADRLSSSNYQNKIGFTLKRADGIVLQDSDYTLKSYPPITLMGSILSKEKSFLYTVDMSGLPASMDHVKLDLIFKEAGIEKNRKEILKPESRVIQEHYVPSLWDSSCKCELLARATNTETNQILVEKALEFSIPEREPWQNCKTGLDHQVPVPWTPVERNGKTLKVWNRDYSFLDSALPAGLTSGGVKMLAKETSFVLTDESGKAIPLTGLKFDNDNFEDEVHFTATADTDDFTTTLNGVLEFDGFCWYELTLIPKHETAKIGHLSLSFYVPESEVLFIQRNSFGTAYAELDSTQKQQTSYPFLRQLLFGNDKRTIGFFWESNEYCRPENSSNLITMTVQDDIREVAYNMIQEPTVIDRPYKYGFGLSASPLKPLPENWRSYIQSYDGRHNKDCNMIQLWSWSKWYGFMRPHTENHFRKDLAALRQHHPNAAIQPYLCQYILSMLSPEYSYYSEEWVTVPRSELMEFGPLYPGKSAVACLGSDSYRSFWIYSFDKFLDDYPEINGCYWDSIDPVSCENALHNHGWVDSQGRRYPTNDILHYRDFYKRCYKILKAKRPDSIIEGHSSQRRNLPTVGFCDVVYDGEQFVSSVSGNMDYCRHFNDLYCRAYFGTQFGLVPLFLPAYYYNSKQVKELTMPTESIFIHALIYDFLVHSHEINSKVTDAIFDITRGFGLSDAEYFAPYDARTDSLLKVTAPKGSDIRRAVYRKPDGKMLSIIGNFGESPVTVTATFSGKKEFVKDCRNATVLALKDNSVILDIPNSNFVILEN